MSEAEEVRKRFEQLKSKIVSEHTQLVKEIEEKAKNILDNLYKELRK